MSDKPVPPAGGDTITISRDDLNAMVAQQVQQQSDAQTQTLLDKIMPALQARTPARPAADVDAGPQLPRTRGTIVVSQAQAVANRIATVHAAFDYRKFLPAAKPFAKALDLNCKRFGYPQLDAFIQICQESGWNPLATSDAGAIGLAQIMPDVAKQWVMDPSDPDASIRVLVMRMAQYRAGYAAELRSGKWNASGDAEMQSFQALDLALAAYDGGPQAVEQAGGVPAYPETQSYVAIIGGTIRAILAGPASRGRWIEDWNALLR